MVFNILSKKQKDIKGPIFNELGGNITFDDMQRLISKRIIQAIRDSPELIGILDTVVTDHFMGEVDFFDVDGRPNLGPTQLRKAERFFSDNKIRDIFYGMGIDYFSDGSTFFWHQSSLDMMDSNQKQRYVAMREIVTATAYGEMITAFNEESEVPRKIGHLAASTVEISHSQTDIISYKQEASGLTKVWSPSNVEHIRLMPFNGEVRSMSGLKALAKETAIMYMIKENLISQLYNGGTADNIISLVNSAGANKSRFQRLTLALESFAHVRKAHGNMPIDAEVKVHPLSPSIKDMEYQNLAMFAVSEFCLAIGMPVSRLNFLMTGTGGPSSKGELSGNSEDAYQKKINNRRLNWESALNPVFRKAGFTYRFRRDNIMDEVKETQAATQRSAFVLSLETSLKNSGKQLTIGAKLALLSGNKKNIDIDDVEELDMELQQKFSNFQNSVNPINENNLKNKKVDIENKISSVRSESKTNTASNNGVHA